MAKVCHNESQGGTKRRCAAHKNRKKHNKRQGISARAAIKNRVQADNEVGKVSKKFGGSFPRPFPDVRKPTNHTGNCMTKKPPGNVPKRNNGNIMCLLKPGCIEYSRGWRGFMLFPVLSQRQPFKRAVQHYAAQF